MEVWKEIKGFKDYYISDFGNIKSLKFNKFTTLKPYTNKFGYCTIGLCINNKVITRYVHRLVAIAFISNPLNKKTVNHINGIKDDNRVENLEWATQSENNKHSYDIGIKKPTNQLGSKNGNAKLTDLQINEIRNLWDKGNITKLKLASIFNVSDAHICRIINKQQRIDIL